MEPAIREFLEKALTACENYDREGYRTLPFEVWPSILDDLGLDDAGEGCRFLMDHLSAAGDGFFTYEPIMKAVQSATHDEFSLQDQAMSAEPPRHMGSASDSPGLFGTRRDGMGGMPPPIIAAASPAAYDYDDRAPPSRYDQPLPVPGPPSMLGGGGRVDDPRPADVGPNDGGGCLGAHGSAGYVGSRAAASGYHGGSAAGTACRAGWYSGSQGYGQERGYGGGSCSGGYDNGSAGEMAPQTVPSFSMCYDRGSSTAPPPPYPPSAAGGVPGLGIVQSMQGDGLGSDAGMPPPSIGYTNDVVEEVNETYWAKRAQAIQQLFTRWDCNELSNGAFTGKLQEVLGDVVDVSSTDSEFVKLSNKHRSARNMKFAALMSALRRDSQTTNTKRFGRPLDHTGLSCYGGSYAGSQYESSVAGSEAASHAAGKATGVSGSQASSFGRKHYGCADSHLRGGVVGPAQAQRSGQQLETIPPSLPGSMAGGRPGTQGSPMVGSPTSHSA
eukprot:CAMPEP_0203895624 /NCGR_PEP_ID=MMETSP0359-20131031/38464_1 /ASSEMBLY_ACC=CAM_ASM_000338 /TAXON_ID=268821 /ORGANISM="Scrippsiella Hangoei, Strain SHTV-5" /LENGTH=498 /DNA_ID=CAMNT_0050818139 /DNA_START=144 /DNA_END=1637 /DNA_ORIENTATION=-